MSRHNEMPIVLEYQMVHVDRIHPQTKRRVHLLRDVLERHLTTTERLPALCAGRGNLLRHGSTRVSCRNGCGHDHR